MAKKATSDYPVVSAKHQMLRQDWICTSRLCGLLKQPDNQKATSQGDKVKPQPLSAKLQARYEKRRLAIEAVREGATVESVAGILKVSLRTVFHWLARYRNGAQQALREGRRSGRPRKLDVEVMRWLYQAITKHDPVW